jgi:hypothetical protein
MTGYHSLLRENPSCLLILLGWGCLRHFLYELVAEGIGKGILEILVRVGQDLHQV